MKCIKKRENLFSFNYMKGFNGITLIALIVTIIILLILASVTIATLTGENGILKNANNAKKQTEISEEKEVLDTKTIMFESAKGSENFIGEELHDKTMENATIWDIIVTSNPNQTYGTNWNYVAKGTKIEGYNETKYDWLVNYETGEVICLENKEYTRLSHGMSLGVTDGLILNIDPSIVDDTNIDDLKDGDTSVLGDNVELNNFNWTDTSGLTNTEFIFDGEDDYIQIKYDDESKKQELANNGFTFEFYGILNGGTSYNADKEIIDYAYKGMFCYWNGIESYQARFRFGIANYGKTILWNAGYKKLESDYSSPGSFWNIKYPETDKVQSGKETYFTITLDCSNSYTENGIEYYKQILYVDGNPLYEGGFNKEVWQNFIDNELDNVNYFCVGRSSMSKNGWWHYSKMNTYTLRLYSKALNTEEVLDNYNKSVAYRNSLLK